MREQSVTCIICPMSCSIRVEGEGDQVLRVEGQLCNRGRQYARDEYLHPMRILTSTVRLENGLEPLLPVRSDVPVPKESLFDCVRAIRSLRVSAPVAFGQVIIHNVLGTGANIIATREMAAV